MSPLSAAAPAFPAWFKIKSNPFPILAPGYQGSLSTVLIALGWQSIPRDLTPAGLGGSIPLPGSLGKLRPRDPRDVLSPLPGFVPGLPGVERLQICSLPGRCCPEMPKKGGKIGFYSSWESRVPKGSRGSSLCWFGRISPKSAACEAQICS